MKDYIIVGAGIAGISFAETCLTHHKSFVVFENYSQQSSQVAAGLYNPIILKRFSAVAGAQSQLDLLHAFYSAIESRLNVKLNYNLPIFRKFFSVEEQNNWFVASEKISLTPFLSPVIKHNSISGINASFGFGQVLQTGYIDTSMLLKSYQSNLLNQKLLIKEDFDYSALKIEDNFVRYKGIQARNIVFAEGFGIHANPYFNYLPLDGTKGELLIIKAPNLDLNVVINSSIFILPLGNSYFKVGATYHWTDKTPEPTVEARQELLDKIQETINCDFEIVDHQAGIRPTVKDRKPMIGQHTTFKNMYVLNGLGTRGVMLGPSMAKVLLEHIEHGIPIDKDIDIKRFNKS
ncbi:MAG TPA: FAD-dependent oxidoreductase [Flavobacterium sp.]|jgi:glycine/D-amino acid oxidase-like deaminating enzyme